MSISVKEIRELESRCLECQSILIGHLEKLSIAATEILGYEVSADLCNGNEIEFRKVDCFGVSDCNSTIRIEEIIDKINN